MKTTKTDKQAVKKAIKAILKKRGWFYDSEDGISTIEDIVTSIKDNKIKTSKRFKKYERDDIFDIYVKLVSDSIFKKLTIKSFINEDGYGDVFYIKDYKKFIEDIL